MRPEPGLKKYQQFLLQELAERKTRNPVYSIRAFARDLDVSSTALCDVLAGKRDLSRKNAEKVASILCLSPGRTQSLMREILKSDYAEGQVDFQTLEEDTFRLLSDWYHFALLNLAKIKTNRASPPWIAKRLGISVLESRHALSLLRRLGFLAIERGRLVRTGRPLFFKPTSMPRALKKFQNQILVKAQESIERDRVEDRYVTSFVMPVDIRKLSAAKEMILNFQKRLMQLLEAGELTEVYVLSVQLFPLTRKESG
jgi:uncharacterized protein (TIGR02147 family)